MASDGTVSFRLKFVSVEAAKKPTVMNSLDGRSEYRRQSGRRVDLEYSIGFRCGHDQHLERTSQGPISQEYGPLHAQSMR